MEGLVSLLIFAVLFFFMMRMHGHGGHGQSHGTATAAKQIDPVCGVEVEADKGYGKMYQGSLYRFCSKNCLDKFDSEPDRYISKEQGADHGA